jgi:methyltransferase
MVTSSYLFLLLAVVVQRLLELRVSRINEAALRERGASEHAPEQMPIMAALHGAWLICCLLEVWLLDRPLRPWLALLSLLVFCVGQSLRLLAMRALGERWTVKVITLPGAPPITGGIFQYLRHPNYTGVVLEIAALPLVHGAWLTAIVFSIANGVLLSRRIAAEERALSLGTSYQQAFRDRPRFVPKLSAHTSDETEKPA